MPSNEDSKDPIQSVFDTLALSARRANLARTGVLAEAVEAVASGGLDEQQRAAAAQAAHQLAGSAGTFGSRRASELAASIERFFEDGHRPAGLGPVREQLTELRRLLERSHQLEE